MRRIGEPWLPGRPYRDRPGVYAILTPVRPDGSILCVDQSGELQLPGGGIDPGEQPVAALHREVLEETGWRIRPHRRVFAFQRYAWLPDYGYWARKVQAVWLGHAVARAGPPSEDDHTPVWVEASLAERVLGVAGDRAAVAHARRAGLLGRV